VFDWALSLHKQIFEEEKYNENAQPNNKKREKRDKRVKEEKGDKR
jgi:hypothetical protein